jgi:hypothetical protein
MQPPFQMRAHCIAWAAVNDPPVAKSHSEARIETTMKLPNCAHLAEVHTPGELFRGLANQVHALSTTSCDRSMYAQSKTKEHSYAAVTWAYEHIFEQ